jgi:hypothetical protein
VKVATAEPVPNAVVVPGRKCAFEAGALVPVQRTIEFDHDIGVTPMSQ